MPRALGIPPPRKSSDHVSAQQESIGLGDNEAWRGHYRPLLFRRRQGRDKHNTVTLERYASEALEPFWRELKRRRGIRRHEEWFQQDGAPPHTAKRSLEFLEEHFPDRHISLKSAVEWAPHSPDLSPLDFFLWGFLKDLCIRWQSRVDPGAERLHHRRDPSPSFPHR